MCLVFTNGNNTFDKDKEWDNYSTYIDLMRLQLENILNHLSIDFQFPRVCKTRYMVSIKQVCVK